jgi:microcystin-dependent protein
MPSTFSPSLRIELIGEGEQSGVWGTTTNNNLGDLLEQAVAGRTTLDVTSGNITLTSLNGVVDQARSAVLAVTGTPGVTRVLTIPNVEKSYTVINQTTNIVQVKTASGAAFDCPPSATTVIACNGSNGVQGSGIAPLTSPAFTGVPTAPTAAGGTSTTQLATTAFVGTALAALIPSGIISMWSGSIASIPTGWALCDGTGGAPDLRDRFVVGAGSTYAVGATGGANTVTLDTTQIPSHTHTGSGSTAATDLAHTHSGTSDATDLTHSHTGSGTTTSANIDHTHSATTGSTDLTHSHTGSGTTANADIAHTHSGTTANANISHTHTGSGNTGDNNVGHTHTGTTSTIGDHVHGYLHSVDPGGVNIQGSGGDGLAPFLSTNTNGAGAHSHTFTTDGQSVNHIHAFSFTTAATDPVHSHGFTTGAMSANEVHAHTYSFTTANALGGHDHSVTTGGMSANATHDHTYSFTTSTFSGNHTHAFTTGGASISMSHGHTFSFTSDATGGGLAHENRPPYYALAFIIKI